MFSRRTLILAAALAATLTIGACSQTRILYGNADWFLRHWVDRWIDASSAQHERMRVLFAQAADAHRRELLPGVVGWLRQVDGEIGTGLNADRLDCLLESADRLLRAHAVVAVELGTQVLADLSPAQIAHLAGRMAERNTDYRDEYLDPDPTQRRRARVARVVERIEDWTGDLTTAQVRLVERAVRAMPELAGDWLAYREAQQRRLLAVLRAAAGAPQPGAGRAALQRLLSAWWVERADQPTALVRRTAQVRSASVAMLVSLDAMLLPTQRATLRENVAALRADLEKAAGAVAPSRLARVDTRVCVAGGASQP